MPKDREFKSDRCPAQALYKGNTGSKTNWPGPEAIKCYGFWRKVGTDCGICISVCPFSHNIPKGLIDRIPEGKEAHLRILEYLESRG